MPPKFQEAQLILSDYRSANTLRKKQEVIQRVKKRFPEIAARLSKLAAEGEESKR